MKFFTSDFHYNHKNICAGISNWGEGTGQRDFQTLPEMNDAIVTAINTAVDVEDVLYFLGDWSFGGMESAKELRKLINCKTIHLIYGNHDANIQKNRTLYDGTKLQELFTSVQSDLIVPIGNNNHAILYHYNIMSWQDIHKGSFHLHGHYHNTLPDRGIRCMDVGIDTRKSMMPYSEYEIIELLGARPAINPEKRTNEKFIK